MMIIKRKKGSHMHNKSFLVFVQKSSSIFLLIYDFYLTSYRQSFSLYACQSMHCYKNLMSTLLKIKKSISKTIFKLTLANKKVFLKNLIFLSLLFIKKTAITISNITKVEL